MAGVTQVYLNEYFKDNVDSIKSVTTNVQGNRLVLGSPYQIDYSLKAVVDETESDIEEELETFLALAFEGENKDNYVAILQDLGLDNIFCKYRHKRLERTETMISK